MLANHALQASKCRSKCPHKECGRPANQGIIHQDTQCECIGQVNASSVFIENMLDLAHTLAQIMILCGLHECKAKSTVDITTYAFLHYDQVCYCPKFADAQSRMRDFPKPKKRLRKEDIFHELGSRCLMNRIEAHLAYTIIKRGFKAFYYEPDINTCDPTWSEKKAVPEECVYVYAAKKTAESYAKFDGLPCDEQRSYETKIKALYKKFFDRMQQRKNTPVDDQCKCCFCAKKHEEEKPCTSKKRAPHKCPHCCKPKTKSKFIHPARAAAKCPVCRKLMKLCICEKHKFGLDWVKSIWYRADFDRYYQDNIVKEDEQYSELRCSHTNSVSADEPPAATEMSGNAPELNGTEPNATGQTIIYEATDTPVLRPPRNGTMVAEVGLTQGPEASPENSPSTLGAAGTEVQNESGTA